MEMEDKVNIQNKNAIKGGGANSVSAWGTLCTFDQ